MTPFNSIIMLYTPCDTVYPRYSNLAYPNPRISEQQNQDYNIIHIHFNDIHIVIELSVIYFSMYFTYLNFSVIRAKIFFACTEGFG